MAGRDVQRLARKLFVRIASQMGVLARNPEADQWVELVCSGVEVDDEDREALSEKAAHLGQRCLIAATAFLEGAGTTVDAHLRAIHAQMDGKEWGADTLQEIAQILTRAGLPIREPQQAVTVRYTCPRCGSSEVEVCFPVWVRPNDFDNRELWDLDAEATPEKDSDKGWCIECQTNVLVRVARASERIDGS